jgi:hypothetical protein
VSVWPEKAWHTAVKHAGKVRNVNQVMWLAVRSVKWGHLLRKRRFDSIVRFVLIVFLFMY